MFNIFKKKLSKIDLLELQELHRIVMYYRFATIQVKGNTALMPRGKDFAAQLEATANILEGVKNQWVGVRLSQLGFPANTKTNINLKNGEIKIVN